MKRFSAFIRILFVFVAVSVLHFTSISQCSICTRTAQQLGEEPAKGLNAGIIYLAFLPLTIALVIFFKWRRSERLG